MKLLDHSDATLHLLLSGKSEVWRDCLLHRQASDTVALMDEGVLGLIVQEQSVIESLGENMKVSVADLQARLGSEVKLAKSLNLIEDVELPGLIESHARCLSWR